MEELNSLKTQLIEVNYFYDIPSLSKYARENKDRLLKSKKDIENLPVICLNNYWIIKNKDTWALNFLENNKYVKTFVLDVDFDSWHLSKKVLSDSLA